MKEEKENVNPRNLDTITFQISAHYTGTVHYIGSSLCSLHTHPGTKKRGPDPTLLNEKKSFSSTNKIK